MQVAFWFGVALNVFSIALNASAGNWGFVGISTCGIGILVYARQALS